MIKEENIYMEKKNKNKKKFAQRRNKVNNP